MGVNTDDEEMSPGSTVTDGVELTEKTCWFEQETEHETSLPQDADGDVGIQERKMAKGTGMPLITSLQNIPSQPTSVVLNTEHNEAHEENINGGDNVPSNTPTSLPSHAYIEDGILELSQAAYVSIDTDTSANDTCIPLEGHTSPVRPAEITILLDTNTNDGRDATTLEEEIHLSDTSTLKQDSPVNPDIEQIDEEGYTPLYEAALEGHLEGVDDLISRGANPPKPSKREIRTLHEAAHEGHAHIVDFLILQGADVNVECDLGQTPLHTAASSGYTYIVESLIAEGAKVNKEDNTGWTPFNAAVQEGHLEAVKYLMSKGAKQNRYDGMTPLFAAAKFGHLDIVKFFISERAYVNEENYTGRIPLHGAAAGGHMKVMEYLVQKGSDVNKKDNTGWTAFNAAVREGHLGAVKYLMTKGAKQNRYDGMTLLYAAAELGYLDVVKYFISKGADVNEEDDTGRISIHGAAARGHMKVMEYHIHEGSNVNKKDKTGWTPFNAAVQYGHLGAVKYLLTEGAKQNRYAGMTPLFAAARYGHLDIVRFFISKGSAVNEENDKGRIPLHGAAINGNIEVMKYLIQQGSHVNKGDVKGWTPFNAAVENGNLEAVKYLITKGARQNRYASMTPLYAAARYGFLDIVKFFTSKRAIVNEEDDIGRIPLHGAAARGHIKVMEYHIQQGSCVNKKDNNGRTPFNAAIQYGHLGAVKCLLTEGAEQNRYDGMTPLFAAARYGHLDIVKFFISKGSVVNEENDTGRIPLHGAAINGNIEVMKYLIQQGSHVNRGDVKGWTPFNAAVENGNLDAVKYLITKGAEQNRDASMTPLYAAARYGNLDIVKFITSKSDVVNEENDTGRIPLRGAAARGHMEVIEYHIQQGSNVNKKDNTGWTPLHAAAQEGHQDIVDYLTLNEADMSLRDIDGLTPLLAVAYTDHPHVVECISSRRNDPGEKETGDPRPGGHQNIITRGYMTVSLKDADTKSRPGQLASQVDNAEDGNDCSNADNAKRGADEFSLKNLSTRPHDVERDIGCLNVNEHLSPPRGGQNEEDTGDPLPGGHHYGAKNFATRGNARKTGIKMKEVDTQLRTGQLASHVDIVEDGYDCTQADNAKRGADKFSFKSLPTRTHYHEKGGNEEHNPFIHAKLKYPDKGKQDPILDQMEAMKSPVATNGADCSSPLGSQTWQYIGFHSPFLQTMETDGHLYEEPDSRRYSLIDENRPMREPSSPINAEKDLPFNETPTELDSFPTHPPDVVHQKLRDENPVSTQGTSSNPVWKIGTKRRTSVYRCPSILTLVQTFLQMIIASAIILAGSPVLVAGIDITERVTLQAGETGVVPFHLPWPPNSTSYGVPYFTLRFESKPRPFCINGEANIEGFKSSSQLSRFTTSVTDLDTSPCVNVMIDNVNSLDEDGYTLTAAWHTFVNVRYETVKKEIVVQIPPGSAKCFITLSEDGDYPYEVHCRATSGSVTTTLSCYQNDRKIDVSGDIVDNGQVTSGIFWLPDNTHFSCCSHDVTLYVSETMCNDFEWPHGKETTRQTVNTVPTSATTPTPQIESHTESGACRQFMLPSLWHFTYPFVYLAFVTIY